ncbi:MAG: chemotaxis protein CheX [Candidatus Omnitrophota bacterium]
MPSKEDFSRAVSESVRSAFATMLSMDLVEDESFDSSTAAAELICNIGLAGALEGSITLFFSNTGACAIVSAMLGMEIESVSPDVCDGMCEMVNVIAGGFKNRVSSLSCPFNLSLPTAVQGQLMHLSVTDGLEKVIRRFSCDKFSFDVELIYKLKPTPDVQSPAPVVNKMSAFEKLKAMTAQVKN